MTNADHVYLGPLPENEYDGPGKFEGNPDQPLARRLHEVTLDSGQVEDLGEVDGFGWWALIDDNDDGRDGWYICHEDNQGFWTIDLGPVGEREARDQWAALVADYEQFTGGDE